MLLEIVDVQLTTIMRVVTEREVRLPTLTGVIK
jgi:hypothetical protein